MIGVEMVRQARRRRTVGAFTAVIVIPLIIVAAFLLNGSPAADPGSGPGFADLASRSGLNFAFFATLAMSQFLLVVVVALFAGDTVAGEAQWGSLRYLLVRPVARSRLLWTKLAVAVGYGLLAIVAVPVVSLLAGTLAFGWGSVQTPVAGGLVANVGVGRLALGTAYIAASLAVVIALSFWFSTLTEQPLSAVGIAVVIMVVSQILDQVSALGVVRSFLPTHYWGAWLDLLGDPVKTDGMVRGLLLAVPYTVIPLVLAFRGFARKDVLS